MFPLLTQPQRPQDAFSDVRSQVTLLLQFPFSVHLCSPSELVRLYPSVQKTVHVSL